MLHLDFCTVPLTLVLQDSCGKSSHMMLTCCALICSDRLNTCMHCRVCGLPEQRDARQPGRVSAADATLQSGPSGGGRLPRL